MKTGKRAADRPDEFEGFVTHAAKFFGRCVGPAAYLAPNRAP